MNPGGAIYGPRGTSKENRRLGGSPIAFQIIDIY